jgi:hypothetical protein
LQDLGYYNYKVTGFFGEFTVKALQDFQKINKLPSDGAAGSQTLNTLYGDSAKRKPVQQPVAATSKPKAVKGKYGKMLDWFKQVQYMWKRGQVCTVTDLDTGISYKMKRVGGEYHSDAAPLTKEDTAKLLRTYGGHWSWDRRAVVVNIGGTLVAASTNGMPHGSTGVPGNGLNLTVNGNPDGHLQQVCIHFLNSRTHIHNMIDPAHQYQIKRAAGLHPSGPPPALIDN